MTAAKIFLTDEERRRLSAEARSKCMSLGNYLRLLAGLKCDRNLPDGNSAHWLRRAIAQGYTESELKRRAKACGLTLKQVCDILS